MRIKNFVLILAIFISIAAIFGCARSEIYGEKILSHNITPVKDILLHPQDYNGKMVTIKGRIAIECETGCWFNFKDGDAVVYVNIEPSGFAIPQRSGRSAVIEGTVAMKEGKPILIGKGVEIR